MFDEIVLIIGSTACNVVKEIGGNKVYNDICSYDFQYYFGIGLIIGLCIIIVSTFKK